MHIAARATELRALGIVAGQIQLHRVILPTVYRKIWAKPRMKATVVKAWYTLTQLGERKTSGVR